MRSSLAATLAALGSAALLAVSFQPVGLGPATGWIAMVPLLFALAQHRGVSAFWLGWCCGFFFNLSMFIVLLPIPALRAFHVVLLCGYLACYPAIWALLISPVQARSPGSLLYAAALWVVLDYAKCNAGFLAFPIGSLAQTQVDDTAIVQSAGLFGEAFVTFLVIYGNLLIWRVLRGASMVGSMGFALPIGAAFAYGAFVLAQESRQTAPSLPVAVLHTSFAAFGAGLLDTSTRTQTTLRYIETTVPSSPRLIALPETSFINLSVRPGALGALHAIADRQGATLVAGVAQARKFDHPATASPSWEQSSLSTRRIRAGAWIFKPGTIDVQRYDKVHRVAFAEYLPLANLVAWPAWLVKPPVEVMETRYARPYSTSNDMRIGIMVCWESVFASHARQLVRDGATALVQLSNEAWFNQTSAGLRHNETVRMRAIELQRPVLVSSNAGPAIIVDRLGRVVARSVSDTGMEWVTANVRPEKSLSWYARLGDVFVAVCAMVAGAAGLSLLAQIRHNRQYLESDPAIQMNI